MRNAPSLVPISQTGTVDLIAQQIRDRIISGSYAAGIQLRETLLAQQLKTSRGPVREALQRLLQEGLLESVRHRGVFVKKLTEADLNDVLLARKTIEKSVAENLLSHPKEAVFVELEQIIEKMRQVAMVSGWSNLADLDMEFHQILVDSRQSQRLSNIYTTLQDETRISMNMLDEAYPDRSEVADEHQLLIDALRGGDLSELSRAIDYHMDHAARKRKNSLSTSNSAESTAGKFLQNS